MTGKRDFVCIDMGTTEIRTVCAHVDEEGVINFLGAGISLAKGFSKGFIYDIKQAKAAIQDSITHAQSLSNCKVTSATLGISARYLSSSFNSIGIVNKIQQHGRFTSTDLRNAFESSVNAKTIDNDSKLLHVIPRSYTINGHSFVGNPIGFHGSRLEVKTHIITATIASIQNLERCVQSIGINIAGLVPNVLASGEAVLTQHERHNGIILADVGGSTTEIAVFKDGSIFHASVLPVAGHHFTRDISIGLGLFYDEAEQIKKKYGNLTKAEQKADTSIEAPRSAKTVSLQIVNDIIRARMEELLRFIMLELPSKDYSLAPSGLVITGGMANLPGIDELAQELLRVPVRIGRTQSVPELPRFDIAPEYTSLAGLLLLNSKYLRNGKSFSFIQAYKNATKSRKEPEVKEPVPKRDKDIRDYERTDELRKPLKVVKTSDVPIGARIKVVGLGGAGCNAVTRMAREQIHGVELIAMNSDAQRLAICEASVHIQLGEQITHGLGASGDPKIGREAAAESYDVIWQVVSGADMVLIVAGMGGGTGTGSAPAIAELARLSGALTIAVVTKPFSFEGTYRTQVAEEGIIDLINKVDALIIIPNQRLLELCDEKTEVDNAFKMADEVLHHGVQAIAEMITVPGFINLDFADIRTIVKDAGLAWMSVGRGSGQNRAAEAAKQALASPLLDVSVKGAKGVLFKVAGNSTLTLFEVNEVAEIIRQAVDPEANIIFGVTHDPNMGNEVQLTLIVTGFTIGDDFIVLARKKEITRLIKGLKREEDDMVVSSAVEDGPETKAPVGLPRVFISYIHENKRRVQNLVRDLEQGGVSVWWDEDGLETGSRWRDRIRNAIRRGDFFLACFSKEYQARRETFMNEELLVAVEQLRMQPRDRIWFIPVRLSSCEIPDIPIGAGESLRDLQWVDLEKDRRKGIARILASVFPNEKLAW